MSQKIKISELTPHKANDFFFDDIEGEAWQEFIDSIKTSGVIEPIVITQDKVIVSGHQRVRACKTLGIEEVDAEVRIIDSEDEVLKQLIETNIRQRGIGNTNPVKFGRCIKELERIRGVRDGSAGGTGANQYTSELDPNNSGEATTQEDLASQLGISTDTLRNYKQLADAIPEIQTLVETGIVTPTTARAIIKKLPKFQQEELAKQWIEEGKKKLTGKEVNEEIERLKAEKQDLKEERDYLQSKLEEEQSREPKVIEKKVEVMPEDYEELKKRDASYLKDYRILEDTKQKIFDENQALKRRIKDLEERKDIAELQRKLEEEAGYFAIRTYDYIQKNGGYVWITERMEQLPKKQRKEFIQTIYAIDAFAKQMVENIGGYNVE